MASPATPAPATSAFGLFDGVEELDAVGPYEVFAYWTRTYPGDGYTVFCLSADGRPVTGAKGLVLGAHTALGHAPPLEVLVHPGGQGTRPLLRDLGHLEWVRGQRGPSRRAGRQRAADDAGKAISPRSIGRIVIVGSHRQRLADGADGFGNSG